MKIGAKNCHVSLNIGVGGDHFLPPLCTQQWDQPKSVVQAKSCYIRKYCKQHYNVCDKKKQGSHIV